MRIALFSMWRSCRAISIILILALSGPVNLYSQPTLRDAREIQLLAQRKVERGLADLLNTLTFDELGEFERRSIVEDSYNTSPNQIFYSDKVIVEDDLDPRREPGTPPLDLTISKYLSNFDLFYPKSEEQTIHFTDLRVSGLKKSDYYYVKVYYTSKFDLRHKQADSVFEPAERVAEVRAERSDKKWVVYITRLAFTSENDIQNPALNDMELAPETSGYAVSDHTEVREKERDAERIALAEYNRWLDAGDDAFNHKDYETALEAYTKADQLNIYDDLLPRRKIYKVKKTLELESQSQAVLLGEYLSRASLAQKNRNYGEAVGLLRKVQLIKPDSSEVIELIRLLNEKSSLKAELDEQFNAGRYNEVIKRYTLILKTDKDNSDHYLGRGLAYSKNNDPGKALKDFDKAIELDVANLAAFKARADLHAEKKDYPKAIADLTNYLNIDPASDLILRQRAELRALTKNHAGTKNDLDNALKINPDNYQNYLARGKYYSNQGVTPLAKEDFSTAIKLRPVSAEAYFYRGLCWYKEGNFENTGKDFQRALELNPSDEVLSGISGTAKIFFDEGIGLSGAKRFDDASVSFKKATLLYPPSADAHFHLAENLFAQQRLQEALESYTQAILYNSNFHRAYFRRGEIYNSLADDLRALEDFKKARLINTSYYLAYYKEAGALYRLKRYKEAAQLLELLKTNERKLGKDFTDEITSKVFNQLGNCYFMLGEYKESIEEQSKAIRKNKQNSDAYYSRARVYEAADFFKKAAEDYIEACKYDPLNPSKKLAVGKIMISTGSPRKAISYLNEVTALDTENRCCKAEAILTKSDLLYSQSDFKGASQSYRLVLQTTPHLLSTRRLTNAGISCLMIKQTEAAHLFLSTAVKNPDVLPESLFAMACYHLQEFNNKEAQEWIEKALKTGAIDRKYLKNNRLLNISSKDKNIFKQIIDRYL